MQARAESLKSEEGELRATCWVTDSSDQLDPVLETVKQGVELLQNTHRGGDPTLKLEKFVLEWVSDLTLSKLTLGRNQEPGKSGASSGLGRETNPSQSFLVSNDAAPSWCRSVSFCVASLSGCRVADHSDAVARLKPPASSI